LGYLDPVRPASQHSKTSHWWSKQASANTRQSVLMNARLRPLGFRPVDLQPAESGQILAGDIVELDGRRGMAAQNATGMRRQLAAVEADHAALRARQDELEHFLLAAPGTGWDEAVAKARSLLILFARTPAAEDPKRATHDQTYLLSWTASKLRRGNRNISEAAWSLYRHEAFAATGRGIAISHQK
jgi:hypothetical protein